ncbi:MAG TPA: transketolase [Thermoleophilia bacterium]|nr:transketolase [Thermoleophilia bacterium]
MGNADEGADLGRLAYKLRRGTIATLCRAQAGHPGGCLSVAEILTALYFKVMRLDPANPGWEDRDRFVLSKGHAAVIYYVALMERGYFPAETLATYDEIDSILQGHPDIRTPGVDVASGSLGQGLSAGVGMALGARLDGRDDVRVYVLLGDGELQEGQVWEAALTGAKFGLDSLLAIVDDNHVQLMGDTAAIMPVEPIPDKWRAFGWNVIECDGHDIAAIVSACEAARAVKGRPSVIVAQTVKGKGVSFMENTHLWHAALVSEEQEERALAELCALEAAHDA